MDPRTAADDIPPLPTVELESSAQPRHAVIWLHGLGADGNDFVPIVEAMFADPGADAAGLPPIRFVFPHAPVRPVTINGGYEMRAWYDIVAQDFSQRREDPAGVRQSARQIEALIARENARGVADERIVLAGFSQGGAVARHAHRLAGILALSTYLPLAETLAAEAGAANRDVPIFMAHGRDDGVIPYAFGQRSGELLRAAGYAVDWRAYAVEHGVCLEEVLDIAGWLRGVFGAAARA